MVVNLLRRGVVKGIGFSTYQAFLFLIPRASADKLLYLPEQSVSVNKKSEVLALAHTLTLFVVPSGLEPELF